MSYAVNLDHYFARIGYDGPRAATLEVLRALHELHPQAIPFENLNPFTGRPVKLDLESVEAKLVTARRGGYCFEQNALFANVLTQLGFNVTPLLARVLWGREPGAVAPRTHMALRIDIGAQAWFADVGFGSVTLSAPLRLTAGAAQHTPLGTFRLADASHDALYLEVQLRDESWARAYRFDLRPVEWIDYETSNWYTSTAPESIFLTTLIVCRVKPGSRIALFNDQFSERAGDGELIGERQIVDVDDFAACLRDEFGLKADGFDLTAVFERVHAQAQHA